MSVQGHGVCTLDTLDMFDTLVAVVALAESEL